MVFVGIDVSKEKHDCYIMDSENTIIQDVFTFKNNQQGFIELLNKIPDIPHQNIKIGLEATGHYSNNLVRFLCEHDFTLTLFNPLQTNRFRKAQTLRKTKTDKVDAKFITLMLFTDTTKPYSPLSYHLEALKSLTRHHFRLTSYRTTLKISITRLLDIIFPEFTSAVYSVHQSSSYALLLEFPNPESISTAHLTHLTNVIQKSSQYRYGRSKAVEIRELAKNSIGSNSPAAAFELQQTIRLINNIQAEVVLLDQQIKEIMDSIDSPILSIPGISYLLGSMILAETSDIQRFETPAKYLAFAGLDPSTHQSGKYVAQTSSMVKHGSTYLRWAMISAARIISNCDPVFKEFLRKKRAEGKPYYVAMSHVARKLSRVIYYLLSTNTQFKSQAA